MTSGETCVRSELRSAADDPGIRSQTDAAKFYRVGL